MSLPGATWAGAATLAAPALRMMLRLRLSHGKELPGRLPERRGIDPTPRPPGKLLWLHAASVGETTSILPVLDRLRRQELTVLFTTGTATSAALLEQRLGPQEHVLHRFVPLDVPAWVARFLDHWRPDAAAFLESELWPNLLRAARARGVPLMLCNARLSSRSFDRWRRMPGFAQELLGSFARIQPRSAEDADRLSRLCAVPLEPAGDLKFAAAPLPVDAAALAGLHQALAGRPAWLAASTHPGEDELAFAVHRALVPRHPGLLTIVAPRHPERGAAIAAAATPLAATRRALGEAPPAEGIWVADTLGEMGLWYRLAPLVFVGRSLVPPGGGQNPLEPARLGCAIATGPLTANFAEHVGVLRQADALEVVRDADALAGFVGRMLADPAQRDAMGARALAAVPGDAALLERTAAAMLALLDRSG
ncbi:MAG TPA: 3-deoxy-D-manno-octulosonic acid transferase [Acetobacteraceae bacterium]|jgi:3-deoxy-D-manno-octulosonic-acid transferase